MAPETNKCKTGGNATTTYDMNNIFEAPPEGALQTAHERALLVEYRSMKIPQTFAKDVTDNSIAQYLTTGDLGFSYYDKESKTRTQVTELTFIVLEAYAGISGWDKESGVSYWSNRVKDSRKDNMTVFASNHQGPLASGLYAKGGFIGGEKLPPNANYTKFVRAYCVQLDRVIELKLTAASERGMQKGVAAAEASTGRKSKWENVFVLSLPDNDHLWGFHLTGYNKETDKGEDYAGKGDLYFSPVFHAGILNPVKQAELWKKCREAQDAERTAHEAYKAKYAQAETVTATHTPQAGYTAASADDPNFPTTMPPINTTITANHIPEDESLPF